MLLVLLSPACTMEVWGSGQFSVTTSQLEKLLAKAKTEMDNGELTIAMETLYEFERLADSPDSPVTDAQRLSAYTMSGRIQCLYNDFASAVLSYEKALKLKGLKPDEKINLLSSYAVSACFLGNQDKAREASAKLREAPALNPYRKAYQIAIVSAYIEKKFGDRRKSTQYFRDALAQIKLGNLPEHLQLTALSELCEYYDATAQADSALNYLTVYAALADKYHSAPMIADSRRGLLRAYMHNNDTLRALGLVNEYLDAIDSVYNPDQFIALNSKRQNEKIERANSTIEDLKFTVTWQKGLIIIFILATAVVVCGIFLRKHFGKLQRELYQRNREIVALAKSSQEPAPEVDDNIDSESSIDRNKDIMSKIEAVLKESSHYCDPDFSLAAMSKLIGSNTKYVSQAINESTGDNFRSYINKLRIYEARQRLADGANFGHLTIQGISESVGFRSTSNFIISFKKITGLTPSLYIKMAKENQ